jgi:hypothetical protein
MMAAWLTWRTSARKNWLQDGHTPSPSADVPRIITSAINGKAIDIPWETDLDIIHMWEQHNGANQQWFLRTATRGSFALLSRLSGKCLEIEDHLAVNGARVRQADYTGALNQQWVITRRGGGTYRLHNRHSGKCLDVLGWNYDDGATVGQWQCNGGSNQCWYIEPPL